MEFAADDDVSPLDAQLAKEVLTVLHTFYPGHAWIADVPPGQNILKIKNLDCDPRGRYGFVFHKTNLQMSNLTRTVMRAGGEFLERWKVERARLQEELALNPRQIFEKPDGA